MTLHRLTLVDGTARPAPADCKPEVLCVIPGWALVRQSQYHKAEWIRRKP